MLPTSLPGPGIRWIPPPPTPCLPHLRRQSAIVPTKAWVVRRWLLVRIPGWADRFPPPPTHAPSSNSFLGDYKPLGVLSSLGRRQEFRAFLLDSTSEKNKVRGDS